MKVILVSSSAKAVGVSTHIYNLARLLNEYGMLDVVLCPGTGWLTKKLAESHIPFVVLSISYRPAQFIASTYRFYAFIRSRRNANVVHLHGRLPLFLSTVPLALCRGLRFVATVHQFLDVGDHGRYLWKLKLETHLLRYMHRLCCVSEPLRQEVISRVGEEKWQSVDVIPNWIQPLWFKHGGTRRGARQSSDGLKICGIGRLSHEKGFDVLINSISFLAKQGLKVGCEIFGEGPDEMKLRNLVVDLGLTENIYFRGNVSDIRHELPNYKCIVIPSRSESFGIVALEAYDAAVPVIASNTPGLASIVLDGRTGLIFEANNPEALAVAIKTVLLRHVDIDLLISNARQLLMEYLPSPKLAQEFRNFYAASSE